VLFSMAPEAAAQSCAEDANCEVRQICNDDGDCASQPCQRDAECGQNGLCLDSGRCGSLNQCYRDSDCGGGGWWCADAYGCFFDELLCNQDEDCAFGLPCTQGQCGYEGCSRDNECDNNLVCMAGECINIDNGCAVDRNCPQGELCNNAGRCAAPTGCVRDDVCELDELCSDDGDCVPYLINVEPVQDFCRNADDCRSNEICFENVCTDAPAPAPLCGQGGLAAMAVLMGLIRKRSR
jgi:hypothetical protein